MSEATAPEQAAPDGATDTPETEPVETPEAAAPSDQPAAEPDRALGQAEYTRSQQAFSALKAELGLDRTATREQVIEAARALREQATAGVAPDDDDSSEEIDPRILEAQERAFRAELRVSEAIYGAPFTQAALELTNFARTTDDPTELMTAFAAFRDQWGTAPGAAPDDEPPPADERTDTPPAPIGLSEGDSGASARQPLNASQAKRESGPIAAVRGIFEAAGIASRPTAPPR